jgi:hypothetical protein
VVNTLSAADFPTAGQNLHYVTPGYAKSPITLTVPKVNDPAYVVKLASLGLTPGQPFPTNTIPAALFDPNALLYFSSGIIPHPTNSNDQVVSSVNVPINVRDDVVRSSRETSAIDTQLTEASSSVP